MQKSERNKKLILLTECSVLLALSIVLSFVKIWEMPMGGSITLLSMLPIAMISIKHGIKTAFPVALLNACVQLFMGIVQGNVFVYCVGAAAVIICVLFDYIIPFSVIGLSGLFKKKGGNFGIIFGIALMIAIRFVCHFITGVVIWKQWAPEGMSPYLYSLVYNGQYMLPECIITCLGAFILIKIPVIRKLLGLKIK